MTRWMMMLALALALAAGCNKPEEADCRKAIRNMQRLLGTDKLHEASNIDSAVRGCRGASKKASVECAIQAQTLDQLKQCDFWREQGGTDEPTPTPGSAAPAPAPGSAAPAPAPGSAAPGACSRLRRAGACSRLRRAGALRPRLAPLPPPRQARGRDPLPRAPPPPRSRSRSRPPRTPIRRSRRSSRRPATPTSVPPR